ncbi:glycosyl hydrolase family 25 [Faecalibacterium prausnitzii]|uniref:Glycosyl hydrolase family 25 n=1 Tax=Faecalibacterium prausnitzii TaxID=853 RepID=A0A3E2W5W0_9FIRM|nr:GH25 family lysozyme [Faecalibacterium prausnitzii]RGC19867.1 glycosyl hydrolase family 25 [Faecalibacterium prausnitzii]
MKKRFDRSGTARRKAVTAIAALTMALVLAVGGAGAATLLSAQPETLTVDAVVPHITAAAPQASSPAAADPAPATESTAAAAPEQAAESTAQQAAPAPAQAKKPETAEIAPAAPEEAVEVPETPAQLAEDTTLEEENSPAMLLEETPELAAQDPQAPAADGTTQNDTASQHTPEDSVLLTPEQIQQALDSGALEDAEAQCIDLTDENGFFQWLFNWLFGSKDKEEEPAPAYSGWRTENGKTYYYAQDTNKKVTGLRSIDGKLYYFDANGVKQDNVTFGIDVSKYQSGLDWNKIKKSGVSFVIIRIGYRGYGAAGNLVKDPMFEEHFTNARNAGLKVGVYFFTQAVNEAEAQEEAEGCNWALNGRMLDYPIFYDTEASTAPHGTGRADGLGVEDRTKCAIAFCERVKELGYKPGVYASTTWYRKRVDYNTLRSRYTIWNAHYGVSSSPIGCDMWQGTRTAHINGYSGELDANISYIG